MKLLEIPIGKVRDHVHEMGNAITTTVQRTTGRQWAMGLVMGLAFFTIADPALAALPTALNPGASAASGDYIGLIQAYWKKGVALLVLIIAALAFLAVGGGGVAKFNDFRNGKAELGDLTMYAVLGVVLLVTVVYLLTTADGIIT